jgi:putative peptide zinc metalloprotease protein
MNVTRVLNVALPEMPARSLSQRPLRLPPDVVSQEHIEDGKPLVRVLIPSTQLMYRFPPQTWALLQLFDGKRSIEEVAQEYSSLRGAEYSAEELRDLAGSLESSGFWYKTPQEKNVQLMQISSEERRKLVRSRQSKFGDLSEITFPAFNPDKFVTWWHGKTSFVYTWWFTLLTIIAFVITALISISHWSEIGTDTLQFYNFTEKSWADVGTFYFMAIFTLAWHEMAHAHTCKHYGGRVPAMGFLLIYLAPAVYTDTAEGFVKGSRYQRFLIAMSGAWSELMICAVVTPIWWLTLPGTTIHSLAYLIMLMTGIAGVLLNWNPLIKLDGYHMLCEVIAISDLKEDSTVYVVAWIKKYIWGLPVEVPYVPKKRRLGFVVYALLSGVYSYLVLYVVARFVGNVFRNFNPDWSFVPELATAALLFKSRIRKLVNFMKFVYLDKKDRVHAWLRTRTAMAMGIALILMLVVPIWRDRAQGRCVMEAVNSVTIRNTVPGVVTAVYLREGSTVSTGAPILRLSNISLESTLARAGARYKVASMRTTSASLQYTDLGTAIQERDQLAAQNYLLASEVGSLTIASPLSGTVITPGMDGRLGTYITAGTELAEVADLNEMRARTYIPEYDISTFQLGAPGRLQVDGIAKVWHGPTVSITPVSAEIDPKLVGPVKFEGLKQPRYFIADVLISNPENRLKPGMAGSARIYGERRSLVALAYRSVKEFLLRKIW